MSAIFAPRERQDDTDAARDYRALNEAFFDGLRDGRLGLPCLNAYSDGIGQSEYRRGWEQGNNEYARACLERNENRYGVMDGQLKMARRAETLAKGELCQTT